MNKSIWLTVQFTKDSMPLWPCPTCEIGKLSVKKNFLLELDSSSKQNEKEPYYPPENEKSYYAGIFTCSNTNCQEAISSCGVIGVELYVDDYREYSEYRNFFIPKFFFPSLHIITVSNNWPTKIKEQVKKSFSHFFNDEAACANSIRTSIEMIMDDKGIKKTVITKKHNRDRLSLHQRIEEFGKQHTEIKPYIMATKWIGNTGSHSDTSLNREKLLDGYDFLEHCLYELYDKKLKLKELSKKANVINKRKKP